MAPMSGDYFQPPAWNGNGNQQNMQSPTPHSGDSRFCNVNQLTRSLQPRPGSTRPGYSFSSSSPTAPSPPALFNQSFSSRGDSDDVGALHIGPNVPYAYTATYNAHSPVANGGAPRARPATEDTAFSMGRQWGREMGRMEEIVARVERENEFFKQEAARYKRERDECRTALALVNERMANLEGEISGLKSKLLKATTPEMQFRTPVHRRARTGSISGHQSAPIVSSKLANATNSPEELSSPKPFSATIQKSTSGGRGETPKLMSLTVYRPNLADAVGPLFAKLEEWAGQYPVETAPNLRQVGLVGNLSGMITEMLRDRMWDDLVQKPELRKVLVVAVLNSHLINFLGAGFLASVEMLSRNRDMAEVKNQMLRVPPQKPSEYNELLERRLEIVKRISENTTYSTQLDEQTKRVTDDIISLLQVLIPRQSINAASKGLRDLVRDVFWIGQRMALTPREWAVTMAQRGDRWDPHYMVQKNEALRNDPKLTDSNGFHYVVRMGISPSITEKDYSSGSLCLKEMCPKTVLLMENPSQKTGFGHPGQKTPGSGGKRK